MSNNPERSTAWQTALTVIQTATPPALPEGAEVMTVVIEYPPGDPGARHTATPADQRLAMCSKARSCSSWKVSRRACSKPAKRSGNPAVT